MNEDQKEVEKRFFEDVRANLDRYVAEYRRRFGNFVSTDNAREFSADYSQSNEARSRYAAAVQEPASLLVKTLYARILPEPDVQTVVFLAGGGGPGKNTSVADMPAFRELLKDQIVYETIMSSIDSAVSKVEAALSAGKDVNIFFVYRPIEAAALGVLDRAAVEGRTYPVEPLAEGHFGAQRTLLELARRYEDNPLVSISVIDNSLGRGQARVSNLDLIERNLYNSIEDVTERARGAINDGYRNQRERGIIIPESVYRALVGGEDLAGQTAGQEEPGAVSGSAQFLGRYRAGLAQQVRESQSPAAQNSPDNARQVFETASRLLNYLESDSYDGPFYCIERGTQEGSLFLTITEKLSRGLILSASGQTENLTIDDSLNSEDLSRFAELDKVLDAQVSIPEPPNVSNTELEM